MTADAARHLYEALACTDDRDMETITAFLTTFSSQVREATVAECAKICDARSKDYYEQSERAANHRANEFANERAYAAGACAGAAKAIRALPPPPGAQTPELRKDSQL